MGGDLQISGMLFVDETDGEFVDDNEEFDPLVFVRRNPRPEAENFGADTAPSNGDDEDSEPYTKDEIAARRDKRRERWDKKQDNREERGHEKEEFTDWECAGGCGSQVSADGEVCDSCEESREGDDPDNEDDT